MPTTSPLSSKTSAVWQIVQTAWGPIGLAATSKGLCQVVLPQFELREKDNHKLLAQKLDGEPGDSEILRRGAFALARTIAQKKDVHAPPLDLTGVSEFDRTVLDATSKIDRSQTLTYAQLAQSIDSRSARAVGAALGRNPLPLLIPCHRVIGSRGDLTGFSAGISTKAQLLAIEGHCFFDDDFSEAKRHLRKTFPEIRPFLSQSITLPRKPKNNLFSALVRTVIYQQLAPRAASAILGRFESALGPIEPSRAETIAQTSVDDLRKLGLSANKAESVRQIAAGVADGSLDSKILLRLPDEKIIESLTSLRGIGRWSAEILMIFELARPDVFPAGDYALRTCFEALCGDHTLADYSQQWLPYRSIASAYLWKAHETVAKQPKMKVS